MKRIKLVAIIAALIAGVGIYQLLKDISKPQEVPRTQVVVALVDIPKNKVVTADMVALTPVATEALLPNVIKDPESIIGKVLSSAVYTGEQITINRIVQEEQTDNLSYRVTPGKRAISLAVSQVSGVAYMVKPEDHVDIVMTYNVEEEVETKKAEDSAKRDADAGDSEDDEAAEGASNRAGSEEEETGEPETVTVTYTRYLIQDVRILAVDAVMSESGLSEFTTVTLELDPEDVLKIINADLQCSLRLALRNGRDTEIQETIDVDLSYIVGKEDTP